MAYIPFPTEKNKNTPKKVKGTYGISLIVGRTTGSLLFHYISLGIPRYPAIIGLSAAYATYATYATYANYISGGNVRTGGMLGGASARAIIAQRRQPLQGVRPILM